MVDPRRIVIVGTGLGGASAAGALRDRGFDGQVTLLGEQPYRPYELPALSKGILLGEAEDPDWVHDTSFYADNDIDLRLRTRVTAVRLGDHEVDADGTALPFDRLLLATGSGPRRLRVPGGDLDNVRRLRRLDDARWLRRELTEGKRVVVVGAGWIGCEVAAAARRHGAEVTVVEPLPVPLQRVLGDRLGAVFRSMHEAEGVTFRLGAEVGEVTAFTGTDGRVSGVSLSDGSSVAADVVLVAVGVRPRSELAHDAGLELAEDGGVLGDAGLRTSAADGDAAADVVLVAVGVRPRSELAHDAGLELAEDGGVLVDAGLRTSAADVYAVGDVAAHFHPRLGRRVRVEHWANAKDQGAHVAGNLLGGSHPYTASPYFFSDQYDLGMEYRGLADPFADELVVRGDLDAREFVAFWLRNGAVTAAMNVNMWDDGDALQSLVDSQARVEPATLVDGDLASLTG